MEYLDHIITPNGISIDPQKIEVISQWALPTTLKALRGFFGLSGYYRKFVKVCGLIAAPLTDMLQRKPSNGRTGLEKPLLSSMKLFYLHQFCKCQILIKNLL